MKRFFKRLRIGASVLVKAAMTPKEAIDVLGIDPGDVGDAQKLKNAYRKAAMQHHPDRGGSPEMMKKVNEAFEVLERVKTVPTTKIDWKERERVYKEAIAFINRELKEKFKPEVYEKYFTELLGKPFMTKEVRYLQSSYHAGFHIEWASQDKETVFAMHALVSLSDVVYSKPSLGGGEPHVVSFPVNASTTILHNNRKVKFTQRTWDSKEISRGMNDPSVLFPKDKVLKKVVTNREKKRKFSKRDMLLAIDKRLDGTYQTSGGAIWAYIPINNMGKSGVGLPLGISVSMYRMTMMGAASWSFHTVSLRLKNEDGKIETDKARLAVNTIPESEETLDLLKDVQKRFKNEKDIKRVASYINTEAKKIQDKWLGR